MLRLTPGRVVGWGFLTLFLLSWMFVLGILVGRGTVSMPRKSQDLERELAGLKENALAKEREEIAAQAKEGLEKTPELDFYIALKKSPPKPPVQPRPSPTPVQPKATPPAPRVTQASPAAARPKEVSRPAVSPTPAVMPAASVASKPEEKPAAAAANPAEAHFTVQVAAFRDLESARKLVETLRGKGYPAYHLRIENSAKEAWFRVRVGAFDNRPAADGTLKKLQGEKYKAVVVGTN